LAKEIECRKQGPEATGIFMNMTGRPRRFRLVHLLLGVPYLAVLWPPFFNRMEPAVAGIPFFYWYQLLWIVLGAAVLIPVYLADERASPK
jgi:hypothetical protein